MDHMRRQFLQTCQILECGNPATMGAHVWVKRYHQNFILPTCQSCNGKTWQKYGENWVHTMPYAVVVRVKPHPNTYDRTNSGTQWGYRAGYRGNHASVGIYWDDSD